MSRFALTHRIVEAGELSLGRWAQTTGDRAYYRDAYYSEKAPVPALSATIPHFATRSVQRLIRAPTPTFEVRTSSTWTGDRVELGPSACQLYYASTVCVAGVAAAALSLFLFVFLKRRFSDTHAMIACVLTVFGSPIFPYATSLYGHVPAAALLMAGVVALDSRAPKRRYWVAGLCLALAAGCEYLTALVVVVMVGFTVWRSGPVPRVRRVTELALGALLPIGIVAAYNTACFGAPWTLGYSHLANPEFVTGHGRGFMGIAWPQPEALWGLTFGTFRGLFYVAPVALLGVIGLAAGLRRADPIVRAFAFGALGLFVANAGYYMWWGGAAMGPRHLVPVLPLLGYGLAWLLSTGHRGVRWAVGLMGALSILQMVGFAGVGVEAPESGDVLLDYLYPRWAAGAVGSLPSAANLGLSLGLHPFASLAPWVIVFVLGGRELLRRVRHLDEDTSTSVHNEPA